MTIQRKRVAKRLASGLLAGAMALGGLAISGASPASANTPTTDRLSGTNRYGTSVAIADALQANAFSKVVLVSGENFPDALAAAALASTLDADSGTAGTQTAPVILTAKDALPAEIENFLVSTSNVSRSADIVLVGGTSAISEDVKTQLVGLGFTATKITRVGGDTRYATAVDISEATGVVGASDNVIIASGTSPVDAMTASAISNANGWPILLAGPSGLDADTQARLKLILASLTTPKIHIVGGPAAVTSDVETQIVSAAVGGKPSIINRIQGTNRYETAAAIATANVAVTSANGSSVALLNGNSWADALSAAPYFGKNNVVPVLVDGSELPAASATFIASNGVANPTSVISIGGGAVVPNSVVASASASNVLSITGTAGSMVAGVSTSIDFTFPGTATTDFETLTGLDCTGTGSANHSLKSTLFAVAGSSLAAFAGGDTDAALDAAGNCVVTVSRTAAFEAGAVVSFLGLAEDAATPAGSASHALAAVVSGPAVADTTKPTFTILGITENAATTDIYIQISEAGIDASDFAAGEVEVYRKADAADGSLTTDICNNGAFSDFAATIVIATCDDNGSPAANIAIAAGDVVKVDASAVADASTNANLEAKLVVALDATKATLSLGSVVATQSTPAVFTVPSMVTLTTTATSAIAGYVANGWRIVGVNSADALPSVDVDSATRRVTISFNFATHDTDDVLWAVANNTAAAALGTWAAVGLGTAKIAASYDAGNTIAPGTLGESTFKVTATASELIVVAPGTLSVRTGSTTNTCAGRTVTGFAAGKTTFVINCTALQAAPVADLAIASLVDLSGNDSVGALVAF